MYLAMSLSKNWDGELSFKATKPYTHFLEFVKFEINQTLPIFLRLEICKEPNLASFTKIKSQIDGINWWLFKNQRSTQHFLYYIIIADGTSTGIRVFKRAFIAWSWY